MSPDGAYVVCGSESGELLFWGRDGKPVLPPAVPQALMWVPQVTCVGSGGGSGPGDLTSGYVYPLVN